MNQTSKRLMGRTTAVLLIAATCASGWIHAGNLEVTPEAAFGPFGYGLTVTLGSCRPSRVTLGPPDDPVSDLQLGCSELTAGGLSVGPPEAVFAAGKSIGLEDAFSIPTGSAFTAVLDKSLDPFAFVGDVTPDGEGSYSAVFFTRLDGLNLDPPDEIQHLAGVMNEASDDVVFGLNLRVDPGTGDHLLVVEARLDDGTLVATAPGDEQVLPAGYNRIEVFWKAGNGDGEISVGVNYGPLLGLTGLSNGSLSLDTVFWGAVSGNLVGSSGTLHLDEYMSSP